MENNIAYYKDIIFYKGVFYAPKENLKNVSLHNRIYTQYIPSDISQLNNLEEAIQTYDKGILLLESFNHNVAHLLWDHMYPSYYGILFHIEEESNSDFQWMVLDKFYERDRNGWNLDIVEQFSGNKVITPNILSLLYEKPLKIPYLIVGIKNIGIGNVRTDFCVSRQLKQHIIDPIETFVNRIYSRYNIKRMTFINNEINELPINIIYAVNKRPYNNIDSLFDKLKKKYSNVSNFSIIDWSKYNFEQQLNILNRTRIIICGVGTCRANTPFLPNGSIEIQTNTHDLDLTNNINFFDYHYGTLSAYVKVFNINHYTLEESKKKSCSSELEKIIDDSINMRNNIIYPIIIDDNIPLYIRNFRGAVNENKFIKWRNSMSNDIGDLIKSDCLNK